MLTQIYNCMCINATFLMRLSAGTGVNIKNSYLFVEAASIDHFLSYRHVWHRLLVQTVFLGRRFKWF